MGVAAMVIVNTTMLLVRRWGCSDMKPLQRVPQRREPGGGEDVRSAAGITAVVAPFTETFCCTEQIDGTYVEGYPPSAFSQHQFHVFRASSPHQLLNKQETAIDPPLLPTHG